jgi:putative transposase
VLEGAPHHVTVRGNNRGSLFTGAADYRTFLRYLRDALQATMSRCYAYCLMTNHAHLILVPSSPTALAQSMQSLGRRYVRCINNAYHRTGTLFEGRFKSALVEQDAYLLACLRYVEWNPVRANMVSDPGDYPWSSYRCHAWGHHDPLVSLDPCYLALGCTPKSRQAAYRQWLNEAKQPTDLLLIDHVTTRGGCLGSSDFLQQLGGQLGRDVALRPPGRPRTIQKLL